MIQDARNLPRPVICVVGPTASGKTNLAQELALRFEGEVVSADAMQVYKGMDIGTGKLSVAERKVPHHGFDLVEPGSSYAVSEFQTFARQAFCTIANSGHNPVLAGGTGLYVRAAIDDYRFPEGEQVENPVRAHYTEFADINGAEALWNELNVRDAASARLIHPNNVRRVIRAFELLDQGLSYAKQCENLSQLAQYVPAIFIGLAVDPPLLANRIEARVDAMFEAGLVEEVKTLLNQGFADALTAAQAIGYKEIVSALRGEYSLDEARRRIVVATRRYAKRQRSWWRPDKRVIWLDANDVQSVEAQERLLHDAETVVKQAWENSTEI